MDDLTFTFFLECPTLIHMTIEGDNTTTTRERFDAENNCHKCGLPFSKRITYTFNDKNTETTEL